MGFARQLGALLIVNLSAVTERLGSVLTIVIGVTCAVGVLVSMLAMDVGARRQEMADVQPDAVMLTSIGAPSSFQSSIPRSEAAIVHDLPDIQKDKAGAPLVVFESFVGAQAHNRATGALVFFPFVGVTPNLASFETKMHITAGRFFRTGLHELIASHACTQEFTGFDLGDRRPIRGSDWTVVGHFVVGHSQECEVYADVDSLMSAFERSNYGVVGVKLRSPADFAAFRQAIKADPTLHLVVRHQSEIVAENFKQLNAILNFVAYFVGAIMAIGATLGAVNSLYTMVDARRRELATLRAIGFGAGAILGSMVCESILLALPGAILGGALSWAFFNGMSASPFGYSLQLVVSPALFVLGIAWALWMGLIGGLLPAWRAARVPVTTALRAT